MLRFDDVGQLEDALSEPTPGVEAVFQKLRGDVIVLGVGGKMGPTLARMAQRAKEANRQSGRVIGVSRFSDPTQGDKLNAWGIDTIQGDLLDPAFVGSLPDAPLVVYMAGMKFGASGNQSLTWAMNTLLPMTVCQRYPNSRIAAFSTGNIYGLVPVDGGGSVETDEPNPQGEYAMSCLGRERTFEHFSRIAGTPVSLLRLNYACEPRYGVIVDLANRILQNEPIDLTMNMVNVIWQRDANAIALLSLGHAASPPFVLNIAGPEQVTIQHIAEQLTEKLERPLKLTGKEQNAAILSNGQKGYKMFGLPTVGLDELIDCTSDWLKGGGEVLGKPTKFEVRDGKF